MMKLLSQDCILVINVTYHGLLLFLHIGGLNLLIFVEYFCMKSIRHIGL